MKNKNSVQKKNNNNSISLTILEDTIKDMAHHIEGFLYPLIIPPGLSIDEDILFSIYPDLLKVGKQRRMNILLYSYGGDAHTAFHVGRLLQSYSDFLSIIILREAKSAATLLACAADEIVLTEISELGPMDPQIHRSDLPSRFSPLAIKHAFDLLEKESEEGHAHIVKSLTDKLPDPLILGEHLKSLETGKDYIIKLLSARMLNGKESGEIADVANKLVTGYPDHGYCIDLEEAQEIGLNAIRNDSKHDKQLLLIMRAFKQAWSEFEQKMRSHDGGEKDEAFEIYMGLKKLASSVADSQKQSKSVKHKAKKSLKKS